MRLKSYFNRRNYGSYPGHCQEMSCMGSSFNNNSYIKNSLNLYYYCETEVCFYQKSMKYWKAMKCVKNETFFRLLNELDLGSNRVSPWYLATTTNSLFVFFILGLGVMLGQGIGDLV